MNAPVSPRLPACFTLPRLCAVTRPRLLLKPQYRAARGVGMNGGYSRRSSADVSTFWPQCGQTMVLGMVVLLGWKAIDTMAAQTSPRARSEARFGGPRVRAYSRTWGRGRRELHAQRDDDDGPDRLLALAVLRRAIEDVSMLSSE